MQHVRYFGRVSSVMNSRRLTSDPQVLETASLLKTHFGSNVAARDPMSASLIGSLGSSTFRRSIDAVWMSLAGCASLRNRHQGPTIMGFEDEAEQSLGRPCRLTDSRSKRTYELTSSIVPRGASS